jgi:hypothetical protein
MKFKKLFQLLVISGAVIGGTSGCAANAQTKDKKMAADGGTAAPDAGSGGGVQGW